MHIPKVVTAARVALVGAAVACASVADVAAAASQDVVGSIHVSSQGLDLSQPAGAQQFYGRVRQAARMVCRDDTRAGLEPVNYSQACYEKALGNAIASIHAPLPRQLYLATHSGREAAVYGIDVPAPLAMQ